MTGPACSPATAAAAYWESVPHAVIWPVVVLATAAAIIASQALITGAFSIVQQASLADNCSCTQIPCLCRLCSTGCARLAHRPSELPSAVHLPTCPTCLP